MATSQVMEQQAQTIEVGQVYEDLHPARNGRRVAVMSGTGSTWVNVYSESGNLTSISRERLLTPYRFRLVGTIWDQSNGRKARRSKK